MSSNHTKVKEKSTEANVNENRNDLEKFIHSLHKKLNEQIGPINDNCDVSETGGYGAMFSYLFRWHASIYRLIWLDMLIWIILYVTLALIYRLALNDDSKTYFEDLVRVLGAWSGQLPTTFLLGFFVSNVVSRWWNIYTSIPKMGSMAQVIRATVGNGKDPKRAEKIRVTLSRYLNLAWILCLWQFCGTLKQRFLILRQIIGSLNKLEMSEEKLDEEMAKNVFNFRSSRAAQVYPVLEKIRLGEVITEKDKEQHVTALLQDLVLLNQDPVVKQYYGEIITPSEISVFDRQARSSNQDFYNVEWWLPMHWAFALVEQAGNEGFIVDTNVGGALCSSLFQWSGKLTTLGNYAMRNLPLVYTQVVIIAAYSVFFVHLLTAQFISPERAAARGITGYWIDYYVPILSLLQQIFIIGWFKVALVLLDPFGNDDEDFPFSAIFNGNLKNGYIMCANQPSLYPKKLHGILGPEGPANDYLDSDPEDGDGPVLVDKGEADKVRHAQEHHRKRAWQNPLYIDEI